MGTLISTITKSRISILCGLIILTIMSGCSSHRRIATTEPTQGRISCAPARYLQANGCTISFSSNAQEITTNGDFYIDRDSIVYFRATMLIELARGIITRDSFAILNRLNRSFYQDPLSVLEKITVLPVSPLLLSHLLTASPCIESYFESNTLRTQSLSETEKELFLKGGESVIVTSKSGAIESLKYISAGKQAYLLIKYSTFVSTVGGSTLPTIIAIDAMSASGKKINISIEIGRWVEGIKKPVNFVIPSGYTREEL